jgi:2-phosphosulfolactate phosphatase
MQLDVAFLPTDLTAPETSLCIVIDALRASSSIATVFGGGATTVAVAGTIEDARLLHRDMPGSLLCGESGGLPPEGFDFGNSPIEFEAADLRGRTLVLATSNGTRALAALDTAPAVFVGSLLNRAACAETALTVLANLDGVTTVTVVCSGVEYGTSFSLEDTVVAGAFVAQFLDNAGQGSCEQTDRAAAAHALWRSYASNPKQAFLDSKHGRYLAAIGMAADLDACARIDRYPVAPRLRVTVDGRLLLEEGHT